MSEEWVPIKGWEGKYEISNLGRVRSLSRKIKSPRGFRTIPDKILKPQLNSKGYYHVQLYDPHKTIKINRIMGFNWLVVPSNYEQLEVCHNDGNKLNNVVSNLRWDTHSENIKDKKKHGTDFHFNKTHCPYGHIYGQNNLIINRDGSRNCKACKQAKSRIAATPELKFFYKEVSDIYYSKIVNGGKKLYMSDFIHLLKG